MNNKPHTLILAMASLAALLMACSTENNTARSRWWHSFNTRYNVYYNGNLAYIDGSLEKENGNKDNYTELIPLYVVGNKQSRDLGKANFDRAIVKAEKAIKLHSIKRRPTWDKNRRKTERDREWLGRKEYNPFLWKAWMLMGRAQFHQGDFDAAASTFNYMSRLYRTQPAIYGKARAWLAKCYIENNQLYDAEDVIRDMERDSIHWQARKEWDYTYADYYIHTEQYEKAIPCLKRVIKREMRKKQKARECFLLGQLEAALGRKAEAYKAYQLTIRQNPPYELEFNARIAQTEVMAETHTKKMVSRLKRMAASDKNKDYLDQVYYAIGNIYLAQRDTAKAIAHYERGAAKAKREGIEKGTLLQRLGDLYWVQERYSDAQRCYGQAIGLLDKERAGYERLARRSKALDELVPYTEAVHLQDSLQALAKMGERERNMAIDRVIVALKEKEKEERRRQQEEEAAQVTRQNELMGDVDDELTRPMPSPRQQDGAWYFYNPMAVQQGKKQFARLWGKRDNVDNWQRANTTVVAGMGAYDGTPEMTDAARDSIARAEAVADSLGEAPDSVQNDPYSREYYLAQIPFDADQKAASDLIIMDGLFNSGVIFKDKLENLPLCERALTRLVAQYPTYERNDETYYHLFLLYARMGHMAQAEGYVGRLKAEYPKSQWTKILSDPCFAQNAKEGEHLEDSIYAATYAAFKAGRYGEVGVNAKLSETRFPMGANRDKFLFVGALTKLDGGDASGCLADMRRLVADYPQSGLAEMAGMILNGVSEGRKLHGGRFDIGEIWARRNVVLSDSDSINAKKLSNERNTNFVFMLVYQPDSVNQNKLLFDLARYNFTSYLVRDFNISVVEDNGARRMQVNGFRNYDEALQYAREALKQKNMAKLIGKARPVIISEENIPLLGANYSYDDYAAFYAKHFAPLKVSTYRLLTEPAEVSTRPSEKAQTPVSETEIDNSLNDTFVMPQISTPTNGTTIPMNETPAPTPTRDRPRTTAMPAEPAPTARRKVPMLSHGADVILDDADGVPPSKARPKAARKRAANTRDKISAKDKKQNAKGNDVKNKTNVPRKTEPRRENYDLEDEYYDLEGF